MKRFDVFRFVVAVGALLLSLVFVPPVFVVAFPCVVAHMLAVRLVRWLRTPPVPPPPAVEPAWDSNSGSPELPWPPPETERERELRESFAARRALPAWTVISRQEFAEAKAARG